MTIKELADRVAALERRAAVPDDYRLEMDVKRLECEVRGHEWDLSSHRAELTGQGHIHACRRCAHCGYCADKTFAGWWRIWRSRCWLWSK